MIKTILHDIKDLNLAPKGKLKIEWAGRQMQVLELLKKKFRQQKPLQNIRIGACLHVTAETANLVEVLQLAGAKVSVCASNPLSTQDDVAASLVKDYYTSVFAIKGEDTKTYYQHVKAVLDTKPQITMDDGADLVSTLHNKFRIQSFDFAQDRNSEFKIKIKNKQNQDWEFYGSSEETTTGVIRLKAMEKDKALKIPVMAVNDSDTKHLFDNRYGTGQSTIDGIMRATNILLAGKKFVICGYGWCGRGLATRARGMGAHVIITEVDPVKALEAVMDGFWVMTIAQAAKIGDIFVTVTGDKNVISYPHIKAMKDGTILANSGHFNVEIAIDDMEKQAKTKRKVRDYITEYTLKDGSKRFVLSEGRLINLSAAEGHPPDVMDMSFANQVLAAKFLVDNYGKLEPKVYQLPIKIDQEIARLKLESMGVKIDHLTTEQKRYLSSWREGT